MMWKRQRIPSLLRQPLAVVAAVAIVGTAVTAGATTMKSVTWTTQQDFETGHPLKNIDTTTSADDVMIGASKEVLRSSVMSLTAGTKMYTIGAERASVAVFDAATNQLLKMIALPGQPSGLAYNSVNNKLYVGNENSVTVIDGNSDVVIKAAVPVVAGAYPIAYNPDQNKIYVANMADRSISVLDGATDTVIGSPVPVVIGPYSASFRSGKLYVTNKYNNAVSVVDGVSDAVEATILVDPITATISDDAPGSRGLVAAASESGITKSDRMYLEWKYNPLLANQNIQFKIRTADDLAALDAVQYAGPTGQDSWYESQGAQPIQDGSRIALPALKYARYTDIMVKLSSDDTASPVLHEVSLVFESFPDLAMTNMAAPPTAGVGKQFSVSSTVVNQGTEDAGPFRVSYFLNDGRGNRNLNCDFSVDALVSGAAQSGTSTCTIPGDVTVGSYFLQACADSGNAVVEGYEDNNCTPLQPITVIQPDLTVPSLSSSHASIPPGQAITLAATVYNIGSDSADSSVLGVYLDDPNAIHPAVVGVNFGRKLDCDVTVSSLNPGASGLQNFSCTIPSDVTAGLYTLKACADYKGTVAEIDESNNCSPAVQLTVIQPDLIVPTVTAPATGVIGKNIDLLVSVINQGRDTASPSTVKWGLRNSTGTRWICEEQVAMALRAEGFAQLTKSCQIPTDLAPGPYDIVAKADFYDVVRESNENNNEKTGNSILIRRLPDLTVAPVSGPGTGVLGSTITVPSTVSNLDGDCTSSFNVKLYLVPAASAVYYADPANALNDSDALSCDRTVASLGAGLSDTGNHVCAISASKAAGSYYLLSVVDKANAIEETNESNNRALGNAISIVSPADLLVSSFDTPYTTYCSEDDVPVCTNYYTNPLVNGSYYWMYPSITNQGGVAAADFKFTIYLTNGSNDYKVGEQTIASLAAGENKYLSLAASLSNIPYGRYNMKACVDTGNVVFEGNESNNCTVTTRTVDVSGKDLVALTPALPSTAPHPYSISSGQTIIIMTPTQNIGMVTASSSYTRGYLHNTVTGVDYTIGDKSIGSLSGGQTQGTMSTYVSGVLQGVPAGTYQLKACADATNAIAEMSEDNNCSLGETITVN